jgi:transglutaminase-like putative cysteine protease
MAMMLRTQRIATRVVNGFQQGEYNDTADVWIVRQRDAHSWVEVYFPKEKVWVPFDPTPFSGQSTTLSTTGILGGVNKYLEALETYWIQYFVAFDDQEQETLVRSARKTFSDYQIKTAILLNAIQDRLTEWWSDLRGDKA